MNALEKSNTERWMMTAIALLVGATVSLWAVEISSYFNATSLTLDSPVELTGLAVLGALTSLALFEAVGFLKECFAMYTPGSQK